MEPARDEQEEVTLTSPVLEYVAAAMEPARDEQEEVRGPWGRDSEVEAAMEPARDEQEEAVASAVFVARDPPQWSLLGMSRKRGCQLRSV